MGQADEHLPVDMRSKRASGVGGGARENKSASLSHSAAISAASGGTDASSERVSESEVKKESANTLTSCPSCKVTLEGEWDFCAKCGLNLIIDPRKILSIEFTQEDLDEYIFRGYLTKAVKVVGKDVILRSSMASDHKEVSEYLMSTWNGQSVLPDFWQNLRNMAVIAIGIVSFDGKPIGETMTERVDWVMARGAALVDLITNKVVLFNRSVTAWLEDPNSFLES